MKLEVGMYVRTKRGQIGKIITIGKDNVAIEFNKMWQDIILKENIIKASPDIIDLIEKGDYVNGVEVINIDNEWITMSDMQVPILKSIANGMIETIVTKEQMEQMAYKVGE